MERLGASQSLAHFRRWHRTRKKTLKCGALRNHRFPDRLRTPPLACTVLALPRPISASTAMKIAQEIRAGNVIMNGKDP
ncbi:MAG TPA: hypothetical protein VKP68_08900, partial [Ramlibacter sp.]|nr:hypothetical protein [Ramlibacter sp.]